MAKSLETQHLDLVTRILDEEWTGTPEALGEALFDATCRISPRGWFSDEFVQRDNARIQQGRRIIRALPSGAELLKLEEKIRIAETYREPKEKKTVSAVRRAATEEEIDAALGGW